MKTTVVPYEDQGVSLEGFAAFPAHEKRPLVILCHAWRGRDEFICERAELMSSWGYAGFALDMYGKGVTGQSKEENAALKKPFIDDRKLLQRRVLKGLQTALELPFVDETRVAVIGLGFGGICALDLARSGADIKAAVSVYGHFEPPNLPKKQIKAKILFFQGYNDPIVPPEELRGFERELNEAKVDWQGHIFGNTVHAFATPSANDAASGAVYNPLAAQRTWTIIRNFLNDSFS
jgi:dienelactone hydrolase